MMQSIIMTIGYIGLALIGAFVLWFVGKFVWAAIATISWTRWQFAVAHHNGGALKTIKWRMLPGAIARRYIDFLGYRQGAYSCRGNAGYWAGVGRWEAWTIPEESK